MDLSNWLERRSTGLEWVNDNEHEHDKTNKITCAPSEDSGQPGHQTDWITKDPRFLQADSGLIRLAECPG